MEFTERPVLIIVGSRPFGKIIAAEGWRAAVRETAVLRTLPSVKRGGW